MELYSNPGYVSAATLRAIVEDDEEDDFDDFDDTTAVPGALMRWQADEVEWFIDVDRTTGRVTLSGVSAQPWHPDGFAAALETFRGVHVNRSSAAYHLATASGVRSDIRRRLPALRTAYASGLRGHPHGAGRCAQGEPEEEQAEQPRNGRGACHLARPLVCIIETEIVTQTYNTLHILD